MTTKLTRRIVARARQAWGGPYGSEEKDESEGHEAMAEPSQRMMKPLLEEMLANLDNDEALLAAYEKLQKQMAKFRPAK
jgi:hypothetical protein